MSYTGNDLATQARSYASTAAAATRRAARDAGTAAEGYCQARSAVRTARWMTMHPELWRPASLQTPDQLEHTARVHAAWADLYLRRSFSATDSAEFYRGLAARYRQMHAARQERMAAS